MTTTEATDAIRLDGHSLTIETVAEIARQRRKIALDADAVARIHKCRALLERKIAARETMYGVNTGIGELATVVLTPEQAREFQKYLLYSHAAGCGEPCAEDDTRAAILSRLNTHCWVIPGFVSKSSKRRSPSSTAASLRSCARKVRWARAAISRRCPRPPSR